MQMAKELTTKAFAVCGWSSFRRGVSPPPPSSLLLLLLLLEVLPLDGVDARCQYDHRHARVLVEQLLAPLQRPAGRLRAESEQEPVRDLLERRQVTLVLCGH